MPLESFLIPLMRGISPGRPSVANGRGGEGVTAGIPRSENNAPLHRPVVPSLLFRLLFSRSSPTVLFPSRRIEDNPDDAAAAHALWRGLLTADKRWRSGARSPPLPPDEARRLQRHSAGRPPKGFARSRWTANWRGRERSRSFQRDTKHRAVDQQVEDQRWRRGRQQGDHRLQAVRRERPGRAQEQGAEGLPRRSALDLETQTTTITITITITPRSADTSSVCGAERLSVSVPRIKNNRLLPRSAVPPVGGVVVEDEQPPQGAAVLGFRRHQQLDGRLHPVGAPDQQEPGLEHSVVPPTGREQNQGSALRGSCFEMELQQSETEPRS
ncbi:hypothetical protein EYF80_024065 [Liparis tanakae]|uniref:Uncharacterized protein n=1 Tax=Liparis tanakae TaxID=230148 RepID=A0A4Z2HLV2_9TELE|nr:hypothetical protein EYF80_024065 [Liparis tanakae]